MNLIPARARNYVYLALIVVNAVATALVSTDVGGRAAVLTVAVIANISSALGLGLAAANTKTGKHADQ